MSTTTTAPLITDPAVAIPQRRLRLVAAAAAVVAVVARVTSIFLWPPDSDASHARMIATAAAHPSAWNAAAAAEAVGWLAAGFAVLTALHLVSGRGRVLTRLGGWVYGVSLLALGFVGGAMNSVTATLASEPNRALMVEVQGDFHEPILNAFVTLILLGELALVVFAVGLARARLIGLVVRRAGGDGTGWIHRHLELVEPPGGARRLRPPGGLVASPRVAPAGSEFRSPDRWCQHHRRTGTGHRLGVNHPRRRLYAVPADGLARARGGPRSNTPAGRAEGSATRTIYAAVTEALEEAYRPPPRIPSSPVIT